MLESGYRQFCPVAMASEILGSRWTILVLRELLAGSTRYNQLRMGLPRMSPALLAKRLRQLEDAGIVQRRRMPDAAGWEYRLTAAGNDLRGVIESVGAWGQQWIETRASLENLDPALLMWDMRRNLDPTPLPERRCVVRFVYPELPPSRRSYWLVVEAGGDVDLCLSDPGFEVDLHVTTDLRTMTAIWMGHTRLRREVEARKVTLNGARAVAGSMDRWLGYSPFEKRRKPQPRAAAG